MILLPGVLSSRVSRISQLSFGWDAKDASLLARTGQLGALTVAAAASGGAITPAYGSALVAGRGEPRFSRVGTVNGLDLSGVTAGQDAERLLYPYAMAVGSLTVVLKLTPTWSAGASRATEHYVFGLGSSGIAQNYLRLSRGGASATSWKITRSVDGPATQTSNTVVEPGTFVWPLEVRGWFDATPSGGFTGFTRVELRDATGATVTSSGSGTTHPVIAGSRWSGEVMGIGHDPALGLGAPISLHSVKLALGVKTFAEMDALA